MLTLLEEVRGPSSKEGKIRNLVSTNRNYTVASAHIVRQSIHNKTGRINGGKGFCLGSLPIFQLLYI